MAVSEFSEEEGEQRLVSSSTCVRSVRVDEKSLLSVNNKVTPVGGVWLFRSRSQLGVFCCFYFYARWLAVRMSVEEIESCPLASSARRGCEHCAVVAGLERVALRDRRNLHNANLSFEGSVSSHFSHDFRATKNLRQTL